MDYLIIFTLLFEPIENNVIDKSLFFYILVLMNFSLSLVSKRAVDAALKCNWKEAIQLNNQILESYPKNLDAKIRLGRAYIQTKDFNKAKKIFKEVLSADPINPIALKNLEFAKNKKVEKNGNGYLKTKSLLKEPGTTQEAKVVLKSNKSITGMFSAGEELFIKIKKKSVDVYKENKGKKSLVGSIDADDIIRRLNCAINKKSIITSTYTRAKDKDIFILIKSSVPVFKADKVDIRPYLKKGAIEEPELEMELDEEPEE